jgi:hypothetical protein
MYLAIVLSTAGGGAQSQHHGPGAHSHGVHTPPGISPYARETRRDIKALSADEQRAWLEGQGAGLARAAELNRHPGPMHVLELGVHLGLSAEQARRSQVLMDRHKAEVRELGAQLVALERELDRLFAVGAHVDGAEASRLAEAIGFMGGRIRASHLRTHIEQTALLSAAQVERYNRLRGYEK